MHLLGAMLVGLLLAQTCAALLVGVGAILVRAMR